MQKMKLTEEQVEAGAKAAYEVVYGDEAKFAQWHTLPEEYRRQWCEEVIAAAPHVQMRSEAEPPSEMEIDTASRDYLLCAGMPGVTRFKFLLGRFCRSRAGKITLLNDKNECLKTENERLKAMQGYTMEQVRDAVRAAYNDGGFAEGCREAERVIERLTAKPKTPEERFKVESANDGTAWIVIDTTTGNHVAESDGFTSKATAGLVRDGLIARAKKEAE